MGYLTILHNLGVPVGVSFKQAYLRQYAHRLFWGEKNQRESNTAMATAIRETQAEELLIPLAKSEPKAPTVIISRDKQDIINYALDRAKKMGKTLE